MKRVWLYLLKRQRRRIRNQRRTLRQFERALVKVHDVASRNDARQHYIIVTLAADRTKLRKLLAEVHFELTFDHYDNAIAMTKDFQGFLPQANT